MPSDCVFKGSPCLKYKVESDGARMEWGGRDGSVGKGTSHASYRWPKFDPWNPWWKEKTSSQMLFL